MQFLTILAAIPLLSSVALADYTIFYVYPEQNCQGKETQVRINGDTCASGVTYSESFRAHYFDGNGKVIIYSDGSKCIGRSVDSFSYSGPPLDTSCHNAAGSFGSMGFTVD